MGMTSQIQLEGVGLQAGNFQLGPIDLAIGKGEYFVLMGPTGSGKSLLIKAICGLVRTGGGKVLLAGKDVTKLPPRRRRIGYVPQDSGLFPHLKVRANIAYPLRVAGASRSRQRQEIDRLAGSLEIEPLLDRRIHGLSGGERQKVALARALATRPELLVLDEPVSALDEPTRKETCHLLNRIADQYDLTALHICHSRREAEQVADRVGILYGGKLVQVGTVEEVEQAPAQPAVARLLNV